MTVAGAGRGGPSTSSLACGVLIGGGAIPLHSFILRHPPTASRKYCLAAKHLTKILGSLSWGESLESGGLRRGKKEEKEYFCVVTFREI